MKSSRCSRRWMIVIAVCLGLYSIVGFFVLPPIVKAQAEKRLSAELGRAVHVGKVRVNPYALSLTLEDFAIQEKNASASFLGWKRLYVNFEALRSLSGDWVLGGIELDNFQAAVAINPDGSFNFSDLLTKFTPSSTAAAPASPARSQRPVRVGHLAVTRARVDFSDHSRRQPFSTVVGPVTFALTDFRTAGSRGAPYRFEALTEAGEKLAWTGTLAADPIESKGSFEVGNVILKKYMPYFEDRVRADLTDGTLSLSGGYEVRVAGDQRLLKLSDGQLHLRDLRVAERANAQPAAELASLDITGIQADAAALTATVSRVVLTGGHITVRREKDGSLNLLDILPPEAAPAPRPGSAAPTPPSLRPDVRLGELALKDFAFDITDHTGPRPAQLRLDGLQFSLKEITLTEATPMPLDLVFTWAPKGTVHVFGKVALTPEPSADLTTEVTALEILPLSPYIEQFINARITRGTVSTANTVHLALAGGSPALNFSGDVTVDKLGLVDAAHNEDLAGVGSFALTALKATTAPQLAISMGEIRLNNPYARVAINADKTINLAGLAKTTPTTKADAPHAEAVPAPASRPSPLPKISIERVTVDGGDFSFTDRSVEPNVRTSITQFGGSIAGLSSENLARADVDLKGSVDGVGPVAITGKVDPLGIRKFVDLKIDFKNIDLLPLSPYSGKFAGYGLTRGKLQVDTRFLLDGTKIDAANVVTLHQFTFGAATNSPDATHLPVRLGVALLKDLDGKIVIDLPVQGALDDPSFRVGKVVMRVVGNLLTKAAVSPFSLIGSMFGGGGEELAFQEFVPGTTELQASERPKLDTLVKALTNRPGLSLGLEGSFDAAADAHAIRLKKFAHALRRQIWEERYATAPNVPPPDELVISPDEHAAMVKKLFDSKFPPGSEFGTPLPALPAVVAPPPAPKGGIFTRLGDWITFKTRRERLAAERENERRAADHQKAAATAATEGLPLEEMTGRLAETLVVDPNELRALAAARAERVRDQLINIGRIAPDRLFLSQSNATANENKGPRVFLSLQ